MTATPGGGTIRRFNVLILHSRYLSGAASGENRVVEDESALLRARGHRVWRWMPQPEDSGSLGRLRLAVGAVWRASAVEVVRSLVQQEQIDIVHAHNLFPMLSPAVLRVANEAGAKVVVTLHNYRMMCLPGTFLRDGATCLDCLGRTPWPGVVHACYRESIAGSASLAASLGLHRGLGTFDLVSRYLAVSSFVKRMHARSGLGPKISVKPNFAKPAVRRQGPGEYFLSIGRLSPEKGLLPVVRGWDPAAGPLLIAGQGPQEAQLRADASEAVRFIGAVPPEDVPALMQRARAILVPSIWYEAAPRVIVEAFACGVPVIASSIGALQEVIVDGATGILVEPEDSQGWRRAAAMMLDDASSERMGGAAFSEWQRLYAPDVVMAMLERVYSDAVSGKGSKRAWG